METAIDAVEMALGGLDKPYPRPCAGQPTADGKSHCCA